MLSRSSIIMYYKCYNTEIEITFYSILQFFVDVLLCIWFSCWTSCHSSILAYNGAFCSTTAIHRLWWLQHTHTQKHGVDKLSALAIVCYLPNASWTHRNSNQHRHLNFTILFSISLCKWQTNKFSTRQNSRGPWFGGSCTSTSINNKK